MSGGGADVDDHTMPTIVSGPKDGEPADQDLVITFSEAIKAGSGAKLTLSSTSGVVFSGDISTDPAIQISGNTLTLHLDKALTIGTSYSLVLWAITDLAGNPFDAGGPTDIRFHSQLSATAQNWKGGDGVDFFHGSDLADTISGEGGRDFLFGHGGNDLLNGGDETSGDGDSIDGGAGNDTINGNLGEDVLNGGADDDLMHGGEGNDLIQGDGGNDLMYGDAGNDSLYGGAGDDTLDGGTGSDFLMDSLGKNLLRGGEGGDTLTAINHFGNNEVEFSSSTLDGGAGDDFLYGSDASTYTGGDGNDWLSIDMLSTTGAISTASGDAGDDSFYLAFSDRANGHLRLSGGDGVDTYILQAFKGVPDSGASIDVTDFKPGAGGDLIDIRALVPADYQGNPFGNGDMKLVTDAAGTGTLLQWKLTGATAGYQTLLHLIGVLPGALDASNVLGFALDGSSKGLTIVGTDFSNSLEGTRGDDVISGLGGNDLLEGGGGNDLLDGGDGSDSLYGQAGNDTLLGGAGSDNLMDSDGANLLDGGDGDDYLTADAAGPGTLLGGAGNDVIYGKTSDQIDGGAGNDRIVVIGGDAPASAYLRGGDGDDRIDFLSSGAVRAAGGGGADLFVLHDGAGSKVTIIDFDVDADKLDLSFIVPTNVVGNPFAAGYLKAEQDGADVKLYIDRDGENQAAFSPTHFATLSGISLAALKPAAFVNGYDPSGKNPGLNIAGTPGDDNLSGNQFDDTIKGGGGNDSLYGEDGNDSLDGGDGDDFLSDHIGNNVLAGGAGNDTLIATIPAYDQPNAKVWNSTLDGGDGDDWLKAGSGNAVVTGGAGKDRIEIVLDYTAGSNVYQFDIDGGDGNDTILFSRSSNAHGIVKASGGAGVDTYRFDLHNGQLDELTIRDFQAGPGGDILDILGLLKAAPTANPFGPGGSLRLVQSGNDTILKQLTDSGDTAGKTVLVLQNVVLSTLTADNFPLGIHPDGSSGGWTLQGTSASEAIHGGFLDDTIHGGGGNDTLYGEGGANVLYGDDGDDQISGNGHGDRIYGGDGKDFLSAHGQDSLYGDADDDYLDAYGDANLLDGGDGKDTIVSRGNGDVLSGGAGNDILHSNGFGAKLDGGAGDDLMTVTTPSTSNPPSDILELEGGDGADTINFEVDGPAVRQVKVHGGAGSDSYIVKYLGPNTVVTITDFQAGDGGDRINLAQISQAMLTSPFGSKGNLKIEQRGADTVIQADLDKSGPGGYTDVLVLKNVDKNTLLWTNFWGGYKPDSRYDGRVIIGTDVGDYLGASANGDTLMGGLGDDQLDDSLGKDSLDGGAGDDILRSFNNSDTLDGGDGKDTLFVFGHDGDDRKADTIVANGGNGDDLIAVNLGTSTGATLVLSGGAGHDTFSIQPPVSGSITITDFQVGAGGDILDAFMDIDWKGGNPFLGYYRIEQRGADAVLIYDADGPDGAGGFRDVVTLKNVDKSKLVADNLGGYAQDGSVTGKLIEGTPQADTLHGTVLNDTIHGGDGNDHLYGGRGDDLLEGGAGNDTIEGDQGDDTLIGGDGNDRLYTNYGGKDLAQGGTGNDFLSAYSGNSVLEGNDGNDLFDAYGLDATSTVAMLGGSGDDYFETSGRFAAGAVLVATGGAGRDVFSNFTPDNVYIVSDFQAGAGGDIISVPGLSSTTNPFTDGHLRLFQAGTTTVVGYDANGSEGGTNYLPMLALANTDASKLTADNFDNHVDPYPAPPPVVTPPPVVVTPPPVVVTPPPVVVTPPAPPVIPGVVTTGGDTSDKLEGSANDDKLDGGAGDDILHGGGGTDLLIGGTGKDTATYGGKLENYKIKHDEGGWHVTDQRSGADSDGNDTLQGVEKLRFADQAVALDVPAEAVESQAYRLYRAAFDRDPDFGGLGYWIDRLEHGASLLGVAEGFANSQEFKDLYGSAPNNADIVLRLYHNILHRDPDPGGYAYWLGILDNKQAPLHYVLAFFSESEENIKTVAEVVGSTGIVYTPIGG